MSQSCDLWIIPVRRSAALLLQWLQNESRVTYYTRGALSHNGNGCYRVNMRSKSYTKQTQFLLTRNTKMVFLASWPLAVAIGYGVLAVAILKFNHPASGTDELSCWQNGKMLCTGWMSYSAVSKTEMCKTLSTRGME